MSCVLAIDSHTARQIGAVTQPGETADVHGVFGVATASYATMQSLTVGPSTLSPAPVWVISSRSPGAPPTLGVQFLREFDGVVFDWERRRIVFLQAPCRPGDLGLPASGWVEIPFIKVRWRAIGDASSGPPGAGDNDSIIAVRVQVGAQEHLALVDTGGSGDLLALAPVPVTRASHQVTATGSGRQGELTGASLAEPLHLGPLRLDTVSVFTPDSPPRLWEDAPTLALGNGILQRWTLWIDFSKGVLRFHAPDHAADGAAIP